MKKIIYSLVIMIAAGSLFTSCIEQVEPLGIQDMRYAKAEYIRALKDLRAADAELVRAEAAHEQARARYVDAMTANLNADTEYQNLLNEYQQLINEARQDTNDFIAAATASAIDKIAKEIELRELKHQKKMVDAQKALAEAEEQLRVALRNIALACQDLTSKEKAAVIAAVQAYEAAFTIEARQEVVVLQAQRTLDSLLMVRESGAIDTSEAGSTYDPSSKAYIGQVDKWKKDIENATLEAAVWTALLIAVPDSVSYDDIDGWKEQIDQLTEDSATVAYNKYQVKTEMANYYTNYIHDGVAFFDTTAKQWIKDNPRPTWSKTDADWITAGEPKSTDSKYADKPDLQDSIKTMPVFAAPKLIETKKMTKETFNKFAYLLSSYNQENPLSKADTKNVFIKVKYNTSGDADTIYFAGPVSQLTGANVKSFIMGAAGNGEGSQTFMYGTKEYTANYGLWGAYDILERELVTAKKKAEKTPEELLEIMNEADSIWSTHRQILIDGVAAYVPFEEAKAALAVEEEFNGKGAEKMVQAIKALNTAYASVYNMTTPATWDTFDSTEFFKAVVAFATAREEYLGEGNEAPTATFDRNDRTTWDRTVFYYSAGEDHSEPILAQKKFTELTYEEFQKGKYDYAIYGPGAGTVDFTDQCMSLGYHPDYQGILNILDQLLGTPFVAALTPATDATVMGALSVSPAEAKWALYNKYDVKTSWDDPTAIYEGASPFTPEELDNAKDTVKLRIKEYIEAYNAFWNVAKATTENVNVTFKYKGTTYGGVDQSVDDYITDYTDAMDSGVEDDIAVAEGLLTAAVEKLCDKSNLNPECYTLATFKPYADEAPIVYFTNGTTIDTTVAMKAILTAVDPKADGTRANNKQWDGKTFEAAGQSAIFNGGATDFWSFMKAAYDYYLATNTTLVQDLVTIKKWIDDVEGEFTKDAARTKPGGNFTQDKKDYDSAVARKPRFEDWTKKLQEFAGEDAEEVSDIVFLTAPTAPTGDKADFTTTANVLISELVEPQNLFGTYPGEWNEDLGGKQLEMAKELFPEYPTELKAWDEEIKATKDALDHYEILMRAAKDAYFAAAEIADELVKSADNKKPENWDELVQNYVDANKRYRARLEGLIKDLLEDIEGYEQSIAKFNAGVPQIDIAIARAENKLRVEKARLDGYKQALDYAKANLDRILEYVKSLDANFVIPEAPTTATI